MTCLWFSIIVRTEDERWKMKKENLIAYHLLESSIGAYIEWLVNEPMRLLLKIKDKDAHLVMLSANAAHKPDSLAYPWRLFFPTVG